MPSLKAILSICLLAIFILASPKNASAAEPFKDMSIFISNFTEVGLADFKAKDILNPAAPGEMLRFGIYHNFINNFKTRIKKCTDKKCPQGSFKVEGKFVAESLKKYFDYTLNHAELNLAGTPYTYDGTFYHFKGMTDDPKEYAEVTKAQKNADKIQMSGRIYFQYDPHKTNATFKAIARPHTFQGKKNFAILAITTGSNP